MSSAPEDGIQVTLYEAPPDIIGMLRAKNEINAKLTADLAQANADKDDLRASLKQQEQDIAIQGNVIDEQDDRIVDLEASLTKQMDESKDLKRDLKHLRYEGSQLMANFCRQNKKLNDQERTIQSLIAQLAIRQRVVDGDNASTSSDLSGADHDLMDLLMNPTSDDEEEDEDINRAKGISSAADNNGSDNSSAANIKSEDEAMDDI